MKSENNKKVLISFDAKAVDTYAGWFRTVNNKAGLLELNLQPYWGFQDLIHKAGTKSKNRFLLWLTAKKRKELSVFLIIPSLRSKIFTMINLSMRLKMVMSVLILMP